MLIDNLYTVLGPTLLLVIIASIFIKMREKRYTDSKQKFAFRMKGTMIVFGGMLIVLWFMLPSTPSLSSFGYPDSISDIDNSKKLLALLQTYNKALVRTTEILHWFIFLFVFWFINIFLEVSKFITKEKDKTI